jgi:hypothetical protein
MTAAIVNAANDGMAHLATEPENVTMVVRPFTIAVSSRDRLAPAERVGSA